MTVVSVVIAALIVFFSLAGAIAALVFAWMWIGGLRKERSEPFRFEVGEKVIRPPVFRSDRYLTARFPDYNRQVVVKRKRNWLGRKVYEAIIPGDVVLIRFREKDAMKEFLND